MVFNQSYLFPSIYHKFQTSCNASHHITREEGRELLSNSYNQKNFNQMAARSSHATEDLICPLCREIYNVPVLLHCGHNICKVCLQNYWEWKGCRECPVCGVETVPGRPPINLQLKIAADEHQVSRISWKPEVCCFHNERLNIFCHNDEKPICLICQTSRTHVIHECSPVEEAARQKKVKKKIKYHCCCGMICFSFTRLHYLHHFFQITA